MPTDIQLEIQGQRLAARLLNPGAQGEPLILLHGITGSLYFWIAEQQPLFISRGPCYALSLPGHYPAAFPPAFSDAQLTAEWMADLLAAAVLQLVGKRPVSLIGHSTGGFAALDIAARCPWLARRVLSISGFAHGRWTGALGMNQDAARRGPLGELLFKLGYRFLGLTPGLYRFAMRFYAHDAPALYANPNLPRSVQETYPAFKSLDLDAMLRYFRRMPDIDITPLLPCIDAPTLVLAGDHDPIVPPDQARLIADRIPGAELALIEGAGHLPFAERQEAYTRVLEAWLAKTD